jgi:hypothetical protein
MSRTILLETELGTQHKYDPAPAPASTAPFTTLKYHISKKETKMKQLICFF